MNEEHEFHILRTLLARCHVQCTLLDENDSPSALLDTRYLAISAISAGSRTTLRDVFGNISEKTQHRLLGDFGVKYIFMKLPLEKKNVLFIGPYLSAPIKEAEVLEAGERLSLSADEQRLFRDYTLSLPILPENDRLFTVIDLFCERIWNTSVFHVTELHGDKLFPLFVTDTDARSASDDEPFAVMKIMEMRYRFENEMIEAVEQGQQHKGGLLEHAFREQMFEKRISDPLRNAKNYCIIMNTLLRKAAERGGVHPFHIDRVSSHFASKIELTNDIKTVPALMREMFDAYCHLVQKHTTKHYSPVVRKAVLLIDADLSAELSLGILAKKLSVSAGYLATVFKRETAVTVSEYIRDKRIRYALHLLDTTSLQIQTVAMHCGIVDVQYFSKIFKKKVGMTPKEYRETRRA